MNKPTKIKIALLVLFFILFNIFILPILRENGQNIEHQKKWSLILKIEEEVEEEEMEDQEVEEEEFVVDDEMILMKNSILRIIQNNDSSELIKYDKNTGKELIGKKSYLNHRNREKYIYSNEGLYIIRKGPKKKVIKLSVDSLQTVWERVLPYESRVKIEKCRDLVLLEITLFDNRYNKYYTIILDDKTGREVFYNTTSEKIKSPKSVHNIFAANEKNWDIYYYFKSIKSVYDASKNELSGIPGYDLHIDSAFAFRMLSKTSPNTSDNIYILNKPKVPFYTINRYFLPDFLEKFAYTTEILPKDIYYKGEAYRIRSKPFFNKNEWYVHLVEKNYEESFCFQNKKTKKHEHINRDIIAHCYSDKYFIGTEKDSKLISCLELGTWKKHHLSFSEKFYINSMKCDDENIYIDIKSQGKRKYYVVPQQFHRQ